LKLPWRDRTVGDVVFSSSVTDNDIARLCELATGGTVLEIGTAYGYATARMAEVAAHVVTVDPHAGYGSMPGSQQFAASSLARLGLDGKVALLVGRSQEILPKLLQAPTRYDLVFVDGDHRFAAVLNDLELGSRLLANNGVLAVHDYGEDTCPEVALAVHHAFARIVDNHAFELIDTLWVL
jgi:predicted O-methyltransferase YrrM